MLSFRRGTDRTCTRMFSRSSRPTPRTKHRRFLRLEPLEQRITLSTYWVSPSGSDSNPGTQAQPWQTLQANVATLLPGATMNIESGTYTGFVVGWDGAGTYGTIDGTAGDPITIQAAPNAAPGSVIINAQDNKTRFGIDLEPGCNYITISGITVNGSSGGIAEYPGHGGGIKICGNNDTVENCTISNINYGFGIINDGGWYTLLQNNTISNIYGQGNTEYGHGIYMSDDSQYGTVIGNTISGCDTHALQFNSDSSDLGGAETYELVANNIFYDNGGNGINAGGIQHSLIHNNLIYNYTSYGMCFYGGDQDVSCSNNVIANNTIYSAEGAGAIRMLNGAAENTVLNNILMDMSTIVYRIAADSTGGLVSNYNIVPSGAQVQSEDNGSNEPFSQWQSSTAQDQHSLIATPAQLFVSPSANNFQELSTSPSIGAGTSTDAPSVDILDNPRPSSNGWDIGAYEYEGATFIAPTVASESPEQNAAGVSVSTTVTATFSEPVQSSTIEFTLASAGGPVAASVSFNSSTYTATLTPTAALASDTTYTATVSGAESSSGVAMGSPFSWSFTTAAPTSVASESPANGATFVAVSTPVSATFNEAVQAGTISFTLASISGSAVAASFAYNSSNDTATLTPSAPLAYNTTYTATVSGAENNSGTPMAAAFSWSFTTGNPVNAAIAAIPNGSVTYDTSDESSQTVTLPSGTTAGDLAVVLLTWNTSQSGRTSSAPTGWSTVAQNVIVQNGNFEGESVYYRVIQAGDSSWSFTMNGSVYMQIVLESFSGINTSSPIDNTGTPSTSIASNTITANSVTVNNSGAWELIGTAGIGDPTAANFTGLSNHCFGATLLYDTTPLNPIPTDSVTVTGDGPAANNEFVAIPFTIAPAATAVVPPTVTRETPASNAAEVSVSTTATATFNEAVQASTITFTLTNSSGTAVAGSVSYNSTTNTTTFTPSSALACNTTYTATVSAQSTSGVSVTAPFSWSFTTDPPAPTVTGESPASGATNVAVSTTATATFSEAVQSSTISFTLNNSSGSSVAASVSYNSATYTATLTPSSALAYNTTYTATVSSGENSAGVPMSSSFTWSFTTDAAPPSVTSETPASGATGVAVSSPVTATFNEAVQSSTISFTLTNSAGTSVPAALSYNSSNYTVTLTPSSALAYGTTYTATVSGANDTAGDPMAAPVSWSFTTDKVQPAVASHTPLSGATGVAVSSPVTATFNEAVQSSTISFTLTNSAGTAVPATLTYNSSTDTATFTPSAALAYGTTYTATVSGAKDTASDPMAGSVTWSFTTDASQPAVSSKTPVSGATGVAVSTPVTATFNEAVQSSTISFTLTNSLGGSVAGTVSYSSTNNTATFTPSSAFAYNTKYTAAVSGAKDSAGDPMSGPLSWSFTTASASTNPIAVVPNGSVTYNTTDESSQTVALPSGTTAGDLAVVLLTWNTSQAWRTSSAPAGWSTIAQNVIGQKGNYEGESVYYRVIQPGDSSWSFTTNAAVYMQIVLQSFSGINTSSPIDNTGTPSTSSGSDAITANSVTVKNSGAWELVGIAQAQESNATATNFTGLSNHSYGATLLSDTTALKSGATGTVTVTGGGAAANNALVAIPFTIAPAATTAPTVTTATASATPANESVSLVNTAQISNQSSSRTVQSGPIQEAVNNGGTVLAPAATGVTSAPSATLHVQSDPHGAVLASLVNDNPIGILPDTLLSALARDLLQVKQRRSVGVAHGVGDQGGLGA